MNIMNKTQKLMIQSAARARQDRTLLIYNIAELCKDKQEILGVLESELKQLGVFK